jgi:hypothetical protein
MVRCRERKVMIKRGIEMCILSLNVDGCANWEELLLLCVECLVGRRKVVDN